MKMQKVYKQLNFKDWTVKEMAVSLYFDAPRYFSKRFPAIIGMSTPKYHTLNNEYRVNY